MLCLAYFFQLPQSTGGMINDVVNKL